MSTTATNAPLVSVYDGQRCIGFVLHHGRGGFEAFDARETNLGTFKSMREAATAISASAVGESEKTAPGITDG